MKNPRPYAMSYSEYRAKQVRRALSYLFWIMAATLLGIMLVAGGAFYYEYAILQSTNGGDSEIK